MSIFQTSLVSVMHQRLQYLSKRTQVLTENIARSDIPGALKKDIKPFKDLVRKKNADPSKSHITSDELMLKIDNKDIVNTNNEIEREMEVLELSHNVITHQALIDILGTMHRLYKTAVSR